MYRDRPGAIWPPASQHPRTTMATQTRSATALGFPLFPRALKKVSVNIPFQNLVRFFGIRKSRCHQSGFSRKSRVHVEFWKTRPELSENAERLFRRRRYWSGEARWSAGSSPRGGGRAGSGALKRERTMRMRHTRTVDIDGGERVAQFLRRGQGTSRLRGFRAERQTRPRCVFAQTRVGHFLGVVVRDERPGGGGRSRRRHHDGARSDHYAWTHSTNQGDSAGRVRATARVEREGDRKPIRFFPLTSLLFEKPRPALGAWRLALPLAAVRPKIKRSSVEQ